jgi:hypothetical protein
MEEQKEIPKGKLNKEIHPNSAARPTDFSTDSTLNCTVCPNEADFERVKELLDKITRSNFYKLKLFLHF